MRIAREMDSFDDATRPACLPFGVSLSRDFEQRTGFLACEVRRCRFDERPYVI